MAGRGPAPNPNARRRAGKAKEVAPATVIDAEPLPEPLGPPLPEEYEWPKRTRDWYDTWRRCEMARTFTVTDWQFLLDTAPLHVAAWEGSVAAAAELRLRVGKLGATPEDRLRLRMDAPRLARHVSSATVKDDHRGCRLAKVDATTRSTSPSARSWPLIARPGGPHRPPWSTS